LAVGRLGVGGLGVGGLSVEGLGVGVEWGQKPPPWPVAGGGAPGYEVRRRAGYGYYLVASGFELNRQQGAHSKMVMPPRKLPPGLVTRNLRPALESAGSADAAGAFKVLVTSPEILLFCF
jgi:hypothetical protein